MLYKLVFITCLGAVLEFLDFAIVILFAGELVEVFLPETGKNGLLWIFAIYSLGSLSRPIGGVLFSHFGDKVGRKQLFRLSIIMMSVATLAIGLLPSYASLGILATMLLAMFRALQGLSVGGELPGAIVFAAEHVAPKHRGLLTAAIIASAILGLVLASSMGVVLHHYLSQEQLTEWGWRIPFVFGSILGIFGYFLRRGIIETPLFTRILNQEAVARVPLAELVKYNFRAVLTGFCLTSAAAAMVALYMLLPPFASRYLDFPTEDVYIFTATTLLILSALTMLSGWLSDKFGRKRMLVIGGIILLVVAFPASNAMLTGSLWLVMALTIVPAGIANGCYVSSVSELFSTRVRYTGLAVCINSGVCVFGGCVPYIIELLNINGVSTGPLLLMLLTGILTVGCSWAMPSRHGCKLDSIGFSSEMQKLSMN